MKVNVVVPTYRPGQKFNKLIEKLYSQTVVPDRIVVINTGKDKFSEFDREYAFTEKFPDVFVKHISAEEFDHGKTRNLGFSLTEEDADVVVMMTQDAIPIDDKLIEKLVSGLSEDVAVAYARQTPGDDSGLLEMVSREFNYPEKSCVKSREDIDTMGIKAFFCSDVCAAYKRDVFYKLGGFVNRAIFNEDMIFARKALMNDFKVSYVSEATVIHSHRYTNMQQLRRNFDLGVSQADNPETFADVKSESEGMRLVKAAWERLKREHRVWAFIPFSVQCFFKLLGYKLGKNYKKLPKSMVLRITTNRNYFK